MSRAEYAAWLGFDRRYPSVGVQLALIYEMLCRLAGGDTRAMGGWLVDPDDQRRSDRRAAAAAVAEAYAAGKG